MAAVTMAAINFPVHYDKEVNLRRICDTIRTAASGGAEFILFPEVALQGYPDLSPSLGSQACAASRRKHFVEAEEIPGRATALITEVCKETGTFAQVGMVERAPSVSILYNAVALIGPSGLLSSYRKLHNHFEYPFFTLGGSLGLTATSFGTVGSLICYDLMFPELARTYALRGATLLAMSSAWPMRDAPREEDFHGQAMNKMAEATALCNQLWVAVSNACGPTPHGLSYWGHSQFIDPYGRVAARAGLDEEILYCEVDTDDPVMAARTSGLFGQNIIQDLRPDMYSLKVES